MMRTTLLFMFLLFTISARSQQHSYFITSPDKVQLNINEYGSGKPVILLAGGPGLSAGYFNDIYPHLPNYRFIVPDQRGTGKSLLPKIDASTISVAQYVEDLEALRIHLKLPKLILAGHSWGGMLAMSYAAKYPGKVDRLILLDAGSAIKNGSYFFDNIMMRLLPEDLPDARPPISVASMKAIHPGYFYSRSRALATRNDITPDALGQETPVIMELLDKDYAKVLSARLAALKTFKAPVYLIQGRQDPMDVSTAFETKGIMPQTKLIFIEKCGHFPWMEEPAVAKVFFSELTKALN